MIFLTTRNRSGKSVMTGRTLRATGLYFFFAARMASGVRGVNGEGVIGICESEAVSSGAGTKVEDRINEDEESGTWRTIGGRDE
jgi:hypothetical protein